MFQDYKIAYLRDHVGVREAQRLSFLRQSVAFILSQSARQIPHAAVVNEFDVTPLVEYAQSARDAETKGEKLDHNSLLKRALRRNFSAFFIKCIGHALYHVPSVNGFFDYSPWRNGGTMYVADDINLSFTVHTNHGVIKPIIRNPHQKTLEQVAQEMRDLSRRARRTDPDELYYRAAKQYVGYALKELNLGSLQAFWILLRAMLTRRRHAKPSLQDVPEEKRLQVEDILGATCTVANIGMMLSGHQTVTVIIPPEVFMLGIGNLHMGPRVVDGEVVPRYVITMVGTLDHRAFDGGEVFPLAQHIQRYIDKPGLLYEWRPGDPV